MGEPSGKRYLVLVTNDALADLAGITDNRLRATIEDKIDKLETSPARQGKPLTGVLSGYRSVRAAGQHYRGIYEIDEDAGGVTVVVVGIRKDRDRKDAYRIASRRLGND